MASAELSIFISHKVATLLHFREKIKEQAINLHFIKLYPTVAKLIHLSIGAKFGIAFQMYLRAI
jgi:hypothetical protein